MTELTAHEKDIIENLLEMKNGTVLDMDRDEFIYFILKYTDINLDEFEEYEESNSANLFRKMWDVESAYTVAVVLKHLLEWYMKHKYYDIDEDYSREYDDTIFVQRIELYSECERVKNNLMYKDFYSLPKQSNKALDILKDDIRESLGRGIPQLVLDRLHTFTVSFLRNICHEHGIEIQNSNGQKYSLTSLVGMIAKFYKNNNAFETEFPVVAIKSSISIYEKFNKIRNDSSYAHANQTLNSMETDFAIKSIINTLSFMDALERMLKYLKRIEDKKQDVMDIELPF